MVEVLVVGILRESKGIRIDKEPGALLTPSSA